MGCDYKSVKCPECRHVIYYRPDKDLTKILSRWSGSPYGEIPIFRYYITCPVCSKYFEIKKR